MALPTPSPGSTCLVTGASSGIGVEIARELARRGHGLTLVARREDLLRDVAEGLARDHGIRAETLAVDLSDADARAAMPAAVEALGLEVSVLVNNAGFSTTGAVAASDHEREVGMVRTNIEAVVDLCSLFLPGMVARGSGAILNVASTAAFQPLPGQAGYGASKSFVLSYTHALRAELKGTGVTATTLCPGPVDTGFGEAAGFAKEDAENSLPKIMWIPAAAVAKAAVDGTASGKAVVIPGVANRIAARFAYLAPRRILGSMLARQHPALRDS
ncbi:MAG TPA: SDR family oxidoreductase [Acidimicrobiales bacterium]|nr:SDR family oxidoreductase [Acidimicrobiales bacterium]